jgi:hypothetical protein
MSGGVELDIYGDDWNLDNIEQQIYSQPSRRYKLYVSSKKRKELDMSNQITTGRIIGTTATCAECNRVFNLLNLADVNEYYYGHDCETEEEDPIDYSASPTPTFTRMFHRMSGL